MTRVPEASMPKRRRGNGDKRLSCRELERIQRPGAIAPDDHVPGLEILHRTARGVKFN